MWRIDPVETGNRKLAVAAAIACAAALALALGGLVAGGSWRWLALPALLGLPVAAATAVRKGGLAQHALVEAHENNRGLVDLPAQATFVVDARGKLLQISRRWFDWTGLDLAQSSGSDWMDALHPNDRDRTKALWLHSLRSGEQFQQEYRLRTRQGDYRWFRARAFPQRNAAGAITRWVGAVEDVHDRHIAEEQLRHTAGLLEMIGNSTGSLIWAKDQDGRMLYMNRALEQLSGVPLADALGKTDREWNPNSAEAEAFAATDRRIMDSGEAEDLEEVFTGGGGITRHYRSIKSPLRNRAGHVIGVVGVATDITEQREAEQRERLLTRELDHRAKNLLAVVQSVVTLTRASNLPDFKQAVEGRIQALGRAHSMLAASRWEGADLHRIAAEELAPYAGTGAARIHLEGPAIVLKPAAAQSIALVVHELATNAVKYGALSTDTGNLDVRWNVSADGLSLVWTESGGPPVAPRTNQSRSGFGTRLIHSSIERQLGGTLGLDWIETGLIVRLELPVDRSVSPSPSSPMNDPQEPAAQDGRDRDPQAA